MAANLTIDGIKFTINTDQDYSNYSNSVLVPVETKKVSENKPDIEYMQNLANNEQEWNKVVNVIDIDFNEAEIKDIDGNTVNIKNAGNLLKVLSNQSDKIKELIDNKLDIEYSNGDLKINY